MIINTNEMYVPLVPSLFYSRTGFDVSWSKRLPPRFETTHFQRKKMTYRDVGRENSESVKVTESVTNLLIQNVGLFGS